MEPILIALIIVSILPIIPLIALLKHLTPIAKDTRIPGIKWLVLFFFAYIIHGFINIIFLRFFIFVLISKIALVSSYPLLVLFTRDTFFRDRKSAYVPIMAIISTGAVIYIILFVLRQNSELYFSLSIMVNSIIIWISAVWLFYAIQQSYSTLNRKNISYRVGKKYIALRYSTLVLFAKGFIQIVMPYEMVTDTELLAIAFLVALCTLIFVQFQFYIWVILSNSKGESRQIEEMGLTEEEIMKQMETVE